MFVGYLSIYKNIIKNSQSENQTFKWGGRWGSNPRMTGPQPAVLTTSPHPPGLCLSLEDELYYRRLFFVCKEFY